MVKKIITIENHIFNFIDTRGGENQIPFIFESNILPHEIQVLIGPNGAGKSRVLHDIVNHWFGKNENKKIGYDKTPNYSGLIVVSYSPFELFPVDLKRFSEVKDKEAYKYFGLRKRKIDNKIILHKLNAKVNAVNSLIQCLQDDFDYGAIKEWSQKISTTINIINEGIDFDSLAVAVQGDAPVRKIMKSNAVDLHYNEMENLYYINITPDIYDEINIDLLKEFLCPTKGIIFLKNKEVVQLSSGQRLFSYIAINILGAIRRNSLILIDEPELFLHPTLEIAFIEMLKKILVRYSAKAIIATHSLVLVREVPKQCVHVFTSEKGDIYINNPPFETFGGDVQRISSYVFGDKSISKPFEKWIDKKLKDYESPKALIDALGENINEELLIYINSQTASDQ